MQRRVLLVLSACALSLAFAGVLAARSSSAHADARRDGRDAAHVVAAPGGTPQLVVRAAPPIGLPPAAVVLCALLLIGSLLSVAPSAPSAVRRRSTSSRAPPLISFA